MGLIIKRLCCAIAICLFFLSCVTNDAVTGALSLDAVIDTLAQRIVATLPQRARVAIVKFDSFSDKISDYIWEELTYSLVNSGITVADRTNLPYIYQELNFQMSGNVDDDTAQSIGKFIGAQSIITGDLLDMGNAYRLRINATNVERAVREVSDRQTILKTRELDNLFIALEKNELVSKTAEYGVDATSKSKPVDAGTLFDRGVSFASKENYDEGIRAFTESLKLNPNFAAAFNHRGNAYARKGELNLALSDYTQALRIDKSFVSAYRARGLTYFLMYDYDKAIVDYTAALRLNKTEAGYLVYAARAKAYDRKQEYGKAIDDFTLAINIEPNDILLYLARGASYYRNNEYEKALADYEKVLELDPSDLEAQRYVDALRIELGY